MTITDNCGAFGQAIIEFAVISLPLFLVFLIAIDAGAFFYGHVHAENAVREGARCAAVGGSTANVKASSQQWLPRFCTNSRRQPNPRTNTKVGDDITVSATWTYRFISPTAAFGLPATTTKTYSVTMRAERARSKRENLWLDCAHYAPSYAATNRARR